MNIPSRTSIRGRGLLAVAIAGLCAVSVTTATDRNAAPAGPAALATPSFVLPPAARKRASGTLVEIKLSPDVSARIQDGEMVAFSSARTADTSALEAVMSSSAVDRVDAMFDASLLRGLATRAQKTGGFNITAPPPDLSRWYRVRLKNGTDMVKFVRNLQSLALIEHAYAAPLPAPLPTADYRPLQTYLQPSSNNGVDADYAHTVYGGRGDFVQITDVEYDWNRTHEDLTKLQAPDAYIPNGTPQPVYGPDHGTAVMGVLGGDENGSGVTGVAPSAVLRMSNANTTAGYYPAQAILNAAYASNYGDVILIEQQYYGTGACSSSFVPLEIIPSVFDAIRTATSYSIHVVEAAGNGSVNLDDPSCFPNGFPNGMGDSGAIIVGAGASSICGSTPRSKLGFSTYGSRVDVQGWGECVTTTGYGDLQGGFVDQYYTRYFNGTSSASPIVAGAVASLSSIAESQGRYVAPANMRSLLKDTGVAQSDPGNGNIGPLPNLYDGIAYLPYYSSGE